MADINPSNLAKKLSAIMSELSGQITRSGEKKGVTRNGGEFSYPVLNEADILAPCARALSTHGVAFLPEVLSVDHWEGTFDTKNKHLCHVLVRFTFLDSESGESLIGAMPGSSLETGDGTAIAKACGDACKSFLRKTFLLSTDEKHANKAAPAPRPAPAPTKTAAAQAQATQQTTTTADAKTERITGTLRQVMDATKNGRKYQWCQIDTVQYVVFDQGLFETLHQAENMRVEVEVEHTPKGKYGVISRLFNAGK